MFARTALFAVLGTAALATVGCSGNAHPAAAGDPSGTPSDTIAQTSAALDEANGGLSTSDEAPAFGDAKVEALPELTTAMADATDPTTATAAAAGAKSFHVALLWGHLPTPHDTDDTDTEPSVMSWVGSVSVDAGAIGVKKTLGFDANDRILARTAATTVAFDSHTLPFVDGLFLRVVVPAGGSTVLHFKTASLTTDLELSDLEKTAGGVDRLSDGRNGLAYIGYADVAGCARGIAFGRWVKFRAKLGGMRGRVIDDEGATIGHVRGIWGHAPKADKNVFFGKYIGIGGEHRGLFAGTYGDGEAVGVWGTRVPKDDGAMQLFYSDGYDKDDGRGVWVGRWSERCQ
jgi:hypothetical protein